MSEETTRDELARLRAALAAMEARHTAELTALRRLVLKPRRWRALVPALCLALVVALVPLSLLAATPFADLNPGSPHNANIDAIYRAGITKGCTPNERYCPNDFVTREEMASFLARTAGLANNPPVANAATLQGYAPDGLVRVSSAFGTSFALGGPTNPSQTATGTIEAPGPGFVLVTAAAEATTTATSGCPCVVSLDILSGSGAVAPYHTALLPVAAGGQPGVASLSNTYMFQVNAAGTQRYIARMSYTGGQV